MGGGEEEGEGGCEGIERINPTASRQASRSSWAVGTDAGRGLDKLTGCPSQSSNMVSVTGANRSRFWIQGRCCVVKSEEIRRVKNRKGGGGGRQDKLTGHLDDRHRCWTKSRTSYQVVRACLATWCHRRLAREQRKG